MNSVDGNAIGGGAYIEATAYSDDSVIVNENVFSGNIAECNVAEARGGGLLSMYGKLIITKNFFVNNSAISNDGICYGGGVSLWEPIGDVVFSENMVNKNFLLSSGNLVGPGIHLWDPSSEVYFINNVFYQNEAAKDHYTYGGGACIFNVEENFLLVEGNMFIENQARAAGGVFVRFSYNARFTNNLFSGNSSFRGGGITIRQDMPTTDFRFEVINNTFMNNAADDWGGAIRMFDDEGGNVISFNNVFWGNEAQNGGNAVSNTSDDTIKIYYSDIDTNDIVGNWVGNENINQDPLFVDTLGHILGGPCHNTGIDQLYLQGITYNAPEDDIDGNPRPQGPYWDIGAHECPMIFVRDVKSEDSFSI